MSLSLCLLLQYLPDGTNREVPSPAEPHAELVPRLPALRQVDQKTLARMVMERGLDHRCCVLLMDPLVAVAHSGQPEVVLSKQ